MCRELEWEVMILPGTVYLWHHMGVVENWKLENLKLGVDDNDNDNDSGIARKGSAALNE